MTEENSAEENAQTPENRFELSIQRIYTKDISFETPNSPKIFTAEWKPNLDLNIGTETHKIEEHVYEVVLKVTATVKSEDKTAYLAEVHQAGIFVVQGIEENQMAPVFNIACPNILFPYAREAISDLVNRGSFPQLALNHVNFEALYMQQVQSQQEQQAKH